MSKKARRSSSWLARAVRLTFTDEGVRLEVVDAGCGFEEPESLAGHYGLLGLYERAELIGGQLAIRFEAGQGTIVSITVRI